MEKNVDLIVDRYSKLIVQNITEFISAYTAGSVRARPEDIPVFVVEMKKYLKPMAKELLSE